MFVASEMWGDDKPKATGAELPVTAEFCEVSECGSLPGDGTGPTEGSTGPDDTNAPCERVYDYATCVDNCDCWYAKHLKECGRNSWCKTIADMERAECIGRCRQDWPY